MRATCSLLVWCFNSPVYDWEEACCAKPLLATIFAELYIYIYSQEDFEFGGHLVHHRWFQLVSNSEAFCAVDYFELPSRTIQGRKRSGIWIHYLDGFAYVPVLCRFPFLYKSLSDCWLRYFLSNYPPYYQWPFCSIFHRAIALAKEEFFRLHILSHFSDANFTFDLSSFSSSLLLHLP